jgi:hypothetical protein
MFGIDDSKADDIERIDRAFPRGPKPRTLPMI